MNKPRILMLSRPCEEACQLIDEVAERIENRDHIYDYVWTGLKKVTSWCPVFSPCTGVDHIDSPTIIHLDDEWKRTEGKNVTSTAEHTMSLMLQLAKKAKIQLKGKRLLVIGDGRIGFMVTEYAEAFGMPVTVVNKTVDWSVILGLFDIITLHIPLNDETKNIISELEFFRMKQGALLVNTSRQEVINIEALKEYLNEGKIYYADDFKNKVDLTQYGAIQTPHIGGNCIEARNLTDVYVAKRLQDYIRRK